MGLTFGRALERDDWSTLAWALALPVAVVKIILILRLETWRKNAGSVLRQPQIMSDVISAALVDTAVSMA